MHYKDIFGREIIERDRSNPTRPRDERPLDTIRGLEYQITGDKTWLTKLETEKFGFDVRPNFYNNIDTVLKENTISDNKQNKEVLEEKEEIGEPSNFWKKITRKKERPK